MKMKKWVLIVCIIIGILPIMTYFCTFHMLPNQIATSYNFAGEVTDTTSRTGVIGLMLLPLIFLPFFYIIPKIDPKGEKYEQFSGFYQWFMVGMTVFMSTMGILTLWQSIHPESQAIQQIITVFVGILFVCLGNYLPKIKQNYTMGIKTPWTLENEVVWYKTHRIGGKCFTCCGVLFLVLRPFVGNWMWLFLSGMVLVGVVPLGMSYVYYRQEVARGEE